MTSKYNVDVDNDTSISLFQYINDNFYGLILLLFSFCIIFFVDYISHINSLGYVLQYQNISNNKIKSSKIKSKSSKIKSSKIKSSKNKIIQK